MKCFERVKTPLNPKVNEKSRTFFSPRFFLQEAPARFDKHAHRPIPANHGTR